MLTAIPVHADTTLKVHGSDGLKSTIQVRNGKGRMSSDDRREYLLYDSGTGTITYVEPKQQQYTQLPHCPMVFSMATENLKSRKYQTCFAS